MGQQVNPLRLKSWHGHYASCPVIFLRVQDLAPTNRLALRLEDERGRFWVAQPEPQGAVDGIMPYLVELPTDVRTVVPEIVLLKPVRASFLVETGAGQQE